MEQGEGGGAPPAMDYASFESYLDNFDTQSDLFDAYADLMQSYDPSAMSWGEQLALFDPDFAQMVLEASYDSPAMPGTENIWADMDFNADPWVLPPEQALYQAEMQVDFAPYLDAMQPDATAAVTADNSLADALSHWNQQDHPYSCAVATTEMILDGYGLDFSESDIAQVFQDAGIYDPQQGTAPTEIDETLNALFEHQGIGLEARELDNWQVSDLQELLDKGVRPLIALDAAETWPGSETSTLNEFMGIPDSGHAVQLIAIEDGPDGQVAVLNDPAAPEGKGMRVPMDTFLDACDDFGNLAIAVEQKAAGGEA
ncbi:MAG: hypothetical protein D6754_08840 [Alphaproteobacteria bacterium]|nr:MAG: hypothetical protein D6754_08840 [Alphaproteobacteria bacterium]